METPELIAQWVIENRYPKSENNKITDIEMYHLIVEKINSIPKFPIELNCQNCKHSNCTNHDKHEFVF